MKRIILVISILFSIAICYGADFLVICDTKIYDGDYNYKGLLKEGEIVKLWDCVIRNEKQNVKLDFDYCAALAINEKKRLCDASTIIPAETIELFDENLLSTKLIEQGLHWTTKTELDILYSQSRSTYYNLHSDFIISDELHRGIYDGPWYEDVCADDIPFHNISFILEDSINYSLHLYVKKITKTNNGYYVETELANNPMVYDFYRNKLFDELLNSKLINLNIVIDGDYLHFYTEKNELLISYALVDSSISEQYLNLMRNDECNLSLVNWPHHADGSCDYYISNKTTTSTHSSTATNNISLNKIMLVTENLKLRSGEATSTQVLAVMQAGTKVKILELGKAETIDGISSNWVKVEVQAGAKDRDGKPIKAGAVGWCYGGYLK